VIAGVCIAAAVVVVLNLRTFGVGLPGPVGGVVRQAQHPSPPANLQLASESHVPLAEILARPAPTRPGLLRDPFEVRQAPATAVVNNLAPAAEPEPEPEAKPAAKTPRKAKPGELLCSAVLLGGERPLALIEGKAYAAGDRVGKYQVQEIKATGVMLIAAGGRTLRLPVGPDSSGAASFKVVTSLSSPADRGRTRLVEQE
jgi:hypothetical protein